MKVGIMGAMTQEVEHLRSGIEGAKVHESGKREFVEGALHGHEVVVVFSRWGKVAASSTATTLIERFGVDLIVFTGVAGAVDRALNVGDIVVASRLVQHDMDASAIPGIARFEVPLLGVAFFDAPSDLVARAGKAAEFYLGEDMRADVSAGALAEFGISNPKVVTGLVASGDQFVASDSTVDDLRRALPQLQCVEMEGAAVAQVAYEHNVPFIVLRTISDKADHSAPVDFPAFVERVASHFTCGCVARLLQNLDT
jgi:adenosylhomocysteine nucleosidase